MPCSGAKRHCTKSGGSYAPLGQVRRLRSQPPAPGKEERQGARQRGAGRLSTEAVANRRGHKSPPISWEEEPRGSASRMMNPLPRGEPVAQLNGAGALASKAPRPRAAAGAGKDESEASRGVPSSQQGRSSRRWIVIRPGCPPPSSRGNTASRAALGRQTQGRHKEEGPAGRDTSSKRSRKTWRCPELGSQASPGQSNKRRGRPAVPNTKRISEKIGQKQISSLPPRGV